MKQRICLALAATVLAAGMTSPMAREAWAADQGATQIVAIPGTGIAVELPRDWRIWSSGTREDPSVVMATDVASQQSCSFSLMESVASAERAAHETVKAVEAQPQHEVLERTFLTLPSGNAVRVSYRFKDAPDDARFVQSEYYLDVPGGVMFAYCAGDEPPADRWLSVIGSAAPVEPEPQPPTTFDPRVEVPAHGFAIDFPEEWLVRPWVSPGPVLGGQMVLRAVTVSGGSGGSGGGFECALEDDTVLPLAPTAASPAEWQATLISSAATNRHEAVEPVVTEVDLPSGPVVRADWERWNGEPATAWIYLDTDGTPAAALLCRSVEPPDDGWRSVAETFDFLSAGA